MPHKGMFKDTKEWRCKKCKSIFTSQGDLRRHQWTDHVELYAKCFDAKQTFEARKMLAIKKKRGRPRKNQFLAMAVPTANLEKSVRELKNGAHIVIPIPGQMQGPDGDMKVSELLKKLRDQRQFMIDVVNLIEGLVKA